MKLVEWSDAENPYTGVPEVTAFAGKLQMRVRTTGFEGDSVAPSVLGHFAFSVEENRGNWRGHHASRATFAEAKAAAMATAREWLGKPVREADGKQMGMGI